MERLFADSAAIEELCERNVEALKGDVKSFFEEVLGFSPYKYQLDLADKFEKNQFTAVRWARQTGKSSSISALLLKYALENPDSYIAIVGQSWRQPYGKTADYVRYVEAADSEKLAKLVKTVALLLQTKVYLFWRRNY